MKQELMAAGIRQFGRPRGVVGRLVGWVLAHRSSNVRRNRWVVALLDVQPSDRVLEVGFGPGIAIAEFARRSGHVHGIDHSEVMVRQASRRNAAAVRAGRVTLARASVEELPFDGPFDIVLAVNSLQFWPEPGERLAELRGRIRPGGRIAVVSQPRLPGATRDTSVTTGREIEAMLLDAGFAVRRREMLEELDPPAVCVLGEA